MATSDSEILDYAIVGGGVAGIYSAWRLLDASRGPQPTIGLFESSNRLGGRLLSVVPPLIPDARVELGGMRYIPGAHPWVSSLVAYLQLATEDLPADEPQNIAYLRRTMLRMYELTDPTKIPYNLRNDERSADLLDNPTAVAAMQVLKATIFTLLGKTITKWQDLTTLTAAEWRTVAEKGTWEGAPLHTLPMRYLMMQALSIEALGYAQDTGGYDSILHTWNAADGFSWNVGDYGPTVTYLHIKDGYEALPQTLASRFATAGGRITMNAPLIRFDVGPDGIVTLVLARRGETTTVKARRLILAMPRRSLELLVQSGAVLGPDNTDVHALIRSVTPIPLFKLGICYERPWWQELPPVDPGKGPQRITSGKSVTDLPIRQCYYWKVDPKTNHAVLLIYDDGIDLDYWADLRDSSAEKYPHNPPATSAATDESGWSKYPAPKRMVEEVHRQLLEMHGNPSNVPPPYSAAYRDWGEDPFGGGANFWPADVRSWDVSARIVQPKPSLPVYICGECYSHAQGWVEGALETAEDMLQHHLGVPKPPWKTSDD